MALSWFMSLMNLSTLDIRTLLHFLKNVQIPNRRAGPNRSQELTGWYAKK